MVEVLAEPPLADRRAQVLVAGGENPHVDVLVAGGPEPTHRALLQDLEELRLERLGQETDLVEEDRPAMRCLQQARLGASRVGEGAALEPEHLGLEQRFGDRRAVDIHEWTVPARARPMDDAREQPLAGTRLALDQHGVNTAHGLLPLEQPLELVPYRFDPRALTEQFSQGAHGASDITPLGFSTSAPSAASSSQALTVIASML